MPTPPPNLSVAPLELRNMLRRMREIDSRSERMINHLQRLLAPGPDDDFDDETQERFPPRRKPATSTRELLSSSAAFADPLEENLATDDGPVALVEQAKRNVEKLTQHRANLWQEQQKCDLLIHQWEKISRSLDNDEDQED